MRKIYYLSLVFMSLFLTACEDVVDLDIPNSPPRLVVDASIVWIKGYTGQHQTIRLTTTTGFYDTIIPTVKGAKVYVKNSNNDVYNFTESDNIQRTGQYVCDNFQPAINETYTLYIELNGETYTATETLISVPQLEEVIQSDEGFNEGDTTLRAYFQDPPDEENYYLHSFIRANKGSNDAIFDDEFVNGNYTYTIRLYDDLQQNEEMIIYLYGISSRYYNYMSKLLSLIPPDTPNPFQTPPISVRGNIVNQTNPDNYPLGYFRLSEASFIEYTVQ